jgi:D-alanine-D-alanine ligase
MMMVNTFKNKMRVGVLFGGRSGEHEVSLMSARSIIDALDPNKYSVLQIGITHEGSWLVGADVLGALTSGKIENLTGACILADPTRNGVYNIHTSDQGELLEFLSHIDVLFPVLHGTYGEDGTMQGLFEIAEVAYVGAGVLGSSLGMDKAVFKDVMRTKKIPVVDSVTFTRAQITSGLDKVLAQSESVAAYPLFVKPVNLGSSVGIRKCHKRSHLVEALQDAARYDRRVLVEKGINAREIEVSVLGNDSPEASVPGEIIPADEFYSYEAKYHNDKSQLLIPAPISPETTKLVQSLAIRSFCAIDCAGMARVDFLLDKETNELYLNELNTIPGFTRISMYPKLWTASGLSYPELVDRLIDLALERKMEKDKTERRYYRS